MKKYVLPLVLLANFTTPAMAKSLEARYECQPRNDGFQMTLEVFSDKTQTKNGRIEVSAVLQTADYIKRPYQLKLEGWRQVNGGKPFYHLISDYMLEEAYVARSAYDDGLFEIIEHNDTLAVVRHNCVRVFGKE